VRIVKQIYDRYGPTVAVLVALIGLTAATANRGDTGGSGAATGVRTGGSAPPSAVTTSTLGANGGPAGTAAGGGGDAGVTGAGGVNGVGASGAADCREDGRMRGIAYTMPPCVPVFTGDNGGETARGVTRDKVIVAVWQAQVDPVTSSLVAAAGVGDRPEDITRTIQVMASYFNNHYETYGREVEFVNVTASGPASDDQAMRADAVHIARDLNAFAVIPFGEPKAFDEEAVAQGLICTPCGLSPPQAFYERARGLAWGGYPPNEAYYRHMAEYIGKRLAGRDAKWAGDPLFQTQPRRFGLIWVENSPLGGGPPDPDRKAAVDFYKRELANYGVELVADVGYQYDLSRVQEHATNAIVQMKNAGVSNLAFVGDPLSPIFFTKEATRQNYFPEWFITGNFVTDGVIVGRLYDQLQWQHAFGISFLYTFPTNFSQGLGYLEYKSASPNDEPASSIATIRMPLETVFTGIHMAGPDLTPTSFANGMYAYPPSGGVFSQWLQYFTVEDPTSPKDFKEIWWNVSGRGQDEYGHDGIGVIMNVDGGRRYQLGQWPSTEPKAFDPDGAIVSADDPYYAAQFEQERARPPTGQRCRSCS